MRETHIKDRSVFSSARNLTGKRFCCISQRNRTGVSTVSSSAEIRIRCYLWCVGRTGSNFALRFSGESKRFPGITSVQPASKRVQTMALN